MRLADQQYIQEAIFNQLKVDVAVFDAKGRYQFVNERCFSDSAMRKWIIGKDDFEYCAYRQRPIELAQKRRQACEQAVQSRTESVWEETLPSAGGPRQFRRHLLPIFAPDGSVRVVLGTGTDLT